MKTKIFRNAAIFLGWTVLLNLSSVQLHASTGGSDFSFNVANANGPVFAVDTTAGGYIWMGGFFNSVNGSTHASEGTANAGDTYYCLAVLNTNGTLDTDFTSTNYNALYASKGGPLDLDVHYVSAIAVDKSQDTVYVAFSQGHNQSGYSPFIARFDAVPGQPGKWTLNSTFTQNTLGHIGGVIYSMAVGDECIYVAAYVTDTNTTPVYHSTVGKFLTSNGTLDTSFVMGNGWGATDSYNTIFQVRFFPAGAGVGPSGPVNWPSSLLLAGVPGVGDSDTAPYAAVNDDVISCADKRLGVAAFLCPGDDGILGGAGGAPYQGYPPGASFPNFELHNYGTARQTPFISGGTNYPADSGSVLSWVEALPDGDVLVAGLFSRIHGTSVNNFAHLLPDGVVDTDFNNSTSLGWVFGMAQQPNGQYLLYGEGSYTQPIYGSVAGWVERRALFPSNSVSFISQPQPTNQVVYEGDSLYIYANASGWPGLLAQWRKDGGDVSGQTNTSLNLQNVTTNDSGQYSVFIQNEALCPVSDVSSNVTVTVLPAPPAPTNDMFANAIVLKGYYVTGTGTLRSATFETGETDTAGVYNGHSVWWTWTAPFSGLAYVDFSASDFSAAVSVYTGNDVSSLTMVTNNYDYGNECECTGFLSDFSFEAVSGTTYRIAVGCAVPSGSMGDISLNLGQVVIPWVQHSPITTNALYGVTVGNHRVVAVGNSNTIITSNDGANWFKDSVSASGSFFVGATFANGLFVVTGDGGMILTSPDGMNWKQQTSGTTNGLWGATYGNGLFVASGDNGTILTSPDGTNWTQQQTSSASSINSLTFNSGQFVAVGGNGEINTSPDGTNWTSQYSPVGGELWSVTSGGGLFVAVDGYGEIVTSPDGTNWTQQVSGTSDTLYNVCYGNGHFLAVGDLGTILLSTDGTNWINDVSGVSDLLYAATYYDNGSFVVVGDNGVILFNQPPRFDFLPENGNQIQFNLTGLNGSTAIIEATPTLSPANWQPIATNIISHGVVTLTGVATNHALFYRARIE